MKVTRERIECDTRGLHKVNTVFLRMDNLKGTEVNSAVFQCETM